MEYDDQVIRQLLEYITIDSKKQITVIFADGLKVVQPLNFLREFKSLRKTTEKSFL